MVSERLAPVPDPVSIRSVSPWTTRMRAGSMPSRAAATWAKAVAWPCPLDSAPIRSSILPSSATTSVVVSVKLKPDM